VSRSINTVTFVASATASSSRSDDDAMSVTSWRRSDKEIDAVPPPPFGLMGVAGDLCVARRRRCPYIASSSLLDLLSQAPSANVILFMERDTGMPNPKLRCCLAAVRHLRCLPHSGGSSCTFGCGEVPFISRSSQGRLSISDCVRDGAVYTVPWLQSGEYALE